MIHKLYPSLNDFENLSRLKVKSSEFANNFEFRNLVVNKPWGYEYLWYENDTVHFSKLDASYETGIDKILIGNAPIKSYSSLSVKL